MVKLGRNYLHQLRVLSNTYFFEWELDNFDKIPYIGYHPIRSPSFVLGERSDTVWQLLLSKELKTDYSDDDDSDYDEDFDDEEEEDCSRVTPMKATRSTKVVCPDEISTYHCTKSPKDKSPKSLTDESSRTKSNKSPSNLGVRSSKHGSDKSPTSVCKKSPTSVCKKSPTSVCKKSTKDKGSEAASSGKNVLSLAEGCAKILSHSKHETKAAGEKAIGFRMTKVEDSSVWEVVQYEIKVKAKVLKEDKDTEVTHLYGKVLTDHGNSFYESDIKHYIIESDLNDIKASLFQAKKLTVEVLIVHKYLDLQPLKVTNDSKLAETQKNIYETKMFADVILKAGDFETLAHKNLLCAKAYGLDCHLQDNPEVMKPELKLDLDDTVAQAMLAFIYCSGIPVEFPLEKCPALHSAAECFEVDGLQEAVASFVKDTWHLRACETCVKEKGKKCGSVASNDLLLDFLSLDEKETEFVMSKQCSHK